jgi:hypothetical protein
MTMKVRCKCGAALRAEDKLAGKRVKCPACGQPFTIPDSIPVPTQTTKVPADTASVADDPLGLGGLSEDPLRLSDNGSTGVTLPSRPKLETGQARAEKKRIFGRLKIDANVLRIVALVLIGFDALLFLKIVPSLLSVSVLLAMIKTLGGWLGFVSVACHIGLIVAGVGILRGERFGKDCANISASILLVLASIDIVILIFNFSGLGRIQELLGARLVVSMVLNVVASVVLPVGILVCVNHPKWRD